MARVPRVGFLYFLMVFAAGFALGPIRVLWLVPRVGERTAELLEMPVMATAIYFAARWAVRRLQGASWNQRLGAGLFALAWLLSFEFGLVLRLRGLSVAEYLESRDPVAGAAYAAALLFFAVAPALLGRRPAD